MVPILPSMTKMACWRTRLPDENIGVGHSPFQPKGWCHIDKKDPFFKILKTSLGKLHT